MRHVRRLLLSTLLTPAALVAAGSAFAQQAPASAPTAAASTEAAQPPLDENAGEAAISDSVDEIVVTGIRRSLEAARDIKRESTQFVDAIVAEDIGRLPDTNVAESLARVSGVQVERGIGEGTDISVRGLRENVILYNGRQIVDSTGRGGNGLDQLGSSTYGLLSLVPSELISRLSVTKLAGADQIAGALGGIIDVQTRLPLAGGRRDQAAATAALTFDDLSERAGYELFGLASTTFANETLGVLLTGSYSQRDLAQHGLDTFSGYTRFTDTTVTPSRVRYGNADVRAQEIAEERDKIGLSGVVQWRPSDRFELIADTFYSRLESERDRFWLSFNPSAGLSNATYSSNDILLTGRATGAVLTNTEFADIESDVWSSALRGRLDLTDSLRTSAEVAYTRSESSYLQRYFRLQPLATITPTVDFDLTSGDFGAFTINGLNLSDPAQLRFTILFDNLYRSETEAVAARNDWTLDLNRGWARSVEFGVRANQLETTQDPLRADIRPAGGIPAVQLGAFIAPFQNNDFLPDDFDGLPRRYLAGFRAAFADGCRSFAAFPAVARDSQCLNPTANTNALSSTFEIQEDFLEGYGKFNFEGALGGAEVAGNVGVRFVSRDLESTGNLISGSGAATPTTFERNDEEVLPSAVARVTLDDLVFRVGAARVVAFPNTEDLNNGLTLFNNAVFDAGGVQTSPGTGNGGAPDLDPFQADQFDASLEWYFAPESLLSVGLFYKDISSFIVQRQSAETYGGVNYLINRRINGEGATVRGVEVLAQVPFSFLPEALEGFGAVATYSYIDSETPITDVAGRTLTFPGLSKNNVNLIGYYERGPVSMRLAYNWRDEFLVSLSAAATGIYNDTYSDLSATFRYEFTDDVSLTLEANNLLDSHQRTYDGAEEGLRTNAVFGRIYKASLGVRF